MTLANPRHELFARALARGQAAAEAYATAGYSRNSRWASELSRSEEVRARVAQLQEQRGRRAEAAVDRVTERLLALAAKAEAKDDVRALAVARACLVEAVRLNGMAPEPGAKLGRAIEDYLDKLDVDGTPAAPPKPGPGGLWAR
jgi:hypothetical protein